MNDRHASDELHRRAMDVVRAAMDASPDRRDAVIDSACGDDRLLRVEVESLLDSHRRAGAFLEQPAAIDAAALASDDGFDNAQLLIGRRIGRYVIVSLLGRGGMGAVFLAEQDEPQRRVALKILPAAMLAFSRDALRRFRRESRVLARLQHPGIASIYEAGTHDDGSGATPFFAMEHIADAEPITDFARRRHLPREARLRLFLQACEAVHYGHQRGVIHRDLKPANILVNDAAAVKIIDFGIARLLSEDDGTEAGPSITRTASGGAIGTPAYMSPEQAAGAMQDLDIRTDVFALGVVLDHLLRDRSEAPADDVPADLRTIIDKAAATERDRRYQSVADLSRDIERFLAHLPIEARPAGRVYAMRLFIRRNRAMVAAAALVMLALLAAVAGTTTGLVRARAAERAAREETRRYQAISGFLASMFRAPDPAHRGGDVRVLDLLRDWEAEIDRQFTDDPAVRSLLHYELGLAYMGLGALDQAEAHLQDSISIRLASFGERDVRTWSARVSLAALWHRQSKLRESEELYARSIEMLRQFAGPDADDTLVARNGYGLVVRDLGRLDEAEAIFSDVLERRLRVNGRLDDSTASTMNNLALLARQRGDAQEAERLYREVLEIDLAIFGERSVRAATTLNNLGALLRAQRRLDEAQDLFRRALEVRRELLDPDHPDVLLSMSNMAMMLVSRGKLDEAEPALREAMEAHLRVGGGRHMGTLIVSNNYANVLIDLDRAAEAVPICQRVCDDARAVFGEDHWRVAWFEAHLARALAANDQFDQAQPLFLSAYQSLHASFGESDPQCQRVAQFFADACADAGREELALEWSQKAGTPPPR